MNKNLIETAIVTLRLQREHGLSNTQMELLLSIAYLRNKGQCFTPDLVAMMPLHATTIRTALADLVTGGWVTTAEFRRLKTKGSGGCRVLEIEHTVKLARMIRQLKNLEMAQPIAA